MNNPLNRSMFRQAGMSKQPMGILASSPELMTTAQKAMMNNKPIKAQKAVSVNTNTPNLIDSLFGTNIGSTRYMQPGNTILKDLMSNFSYGGSDIPQTVETKLVKKGEKIPVAKDITKTNNEKSSLFGIGLVGPDGKTEMRENQVIDPLEDIRLTNEKYQKSLVPTKNDSEFIKDIKSIGRSVSGGYDTIVKKIDNGLDYFRNEAEKETAATNTLSGMQEELNARASGDPNYQFTNQFAGASRMAPPSTGERGLVDPENISTRPDTPVPMLRPAEIAGLSILDKIKEDAKNPNGTTTQGSDDALGIADLSFKDRVKARRDIISAALGRDVAEKDVRTDVNYNLIMTGLLVAAGESPNAMTNIAKGLAGGLAGYGKAAGESAEAKRKEEIAIGLAAVEQEFKSDEAQKARDKVPDSIRALEIYKKRPDLLQIALQLKKKGKTRQEIATAIAAKAAGSNSLMPLTNEEMNRYVDFAMSGGASSSLNTVVNIPNSIRIDFNGEDSSGRVGDIVPYRGQSYEIGKNGIATLVTKK